MVTRLIEDRRISADYGRREEAVGPKARIVRLPFGPKRYLCKELLWPHLDEVADELVRHVCRRGRKPDWLHTHYADAGYVAALVSRRLNIPMVFTGHSLGREKLHLKMLLEALPCRPQGGSRWHSSWCPWVEQPMVHRRHRSDAAVPPWPLARQERITASD